MPQGIVCRQGMEYGIHSFLSPSVSLVLIQPTQYKIEEEGPKSFSFFNWLRWLGPQKGILSPWGPEKREKKKGLYLLPYLHLMKNDKSWPREDRLPHP